MGRQKKVGASRKTNPPICVPIISMHYPNTIREHRYAAGLKQQDLAALLKIGSPQLSLVERGRVEAYPKLRRMLAEVLQVKEEELFPEEDCPVAGKKHQQEI